MHEPTTEQIEACIEEFLEIKAAVANGGGPDAVRLLQDLERRMTAAAIGILMLFKFGSSNPEQRVVEEVLDVVPPRVRRTVFVTPATYDELKGILLSMERVDRRAIGILERIVGREMINMNGVGVLKSEDWSG